MSKKLLLLAAGLFLTGFSSPALAGHGYDGVVLHAGPGSHYAIMGTVRYGDVMRIRECGPGWNWCAVDWRGYSAWIPATYLQTGYTGLAVRPRPSVIWPVAVYRDNDRDDCHRPPYRKWDDRRYHDHGHGHGHKKGNDHRDHR